MYVCMQVLPSSKPVYHLKSVSGTIFKFELLQSVSGHLSVVKIMSKSFYLFLANAFFRL